jgi:23S rRNA (cytosine1962-C5)-methyltransferase
MSGLATWFSFHSMDAGTDATIIEHLSQGSDHPVSLHFPEGAYLKGLVCVKG